MSRKLFGTDGIRGKANAGAMTAEVILKVAMAAARKLGNDSYRHKVVIGKDTRLSGYMLEPALTAGFISMGMDVVLLGPIPTPGVAMLTRSLRADLGVMISASHNPYGDNGIKLFAADGYKLSDALEEEIEEEVQKNFDNLPEELGRASRLDDATGRYIEAVKHTFPKGLRLDGLKIVVDCANGAAYKVAPKILWELGAEVISIAVQPDGTNINKDCGATSVGALQEEVVRQHADIGLALDGDADRIMICDEEGQVVDGDQIMALIAKNWHEQGLLKGDAVVATVMSNLGLEMFLKKMGIGLKRMPVGDRYVVDHMKSNNYNLGGEQSGHVILGDYSTTGDGLIAALQVLAVLQQSNGKRASEICHVYKPVPQSLVNIRYDTDGLLESSELIDLLSDMEKKLEGKGRLLVRKSGTETLIRVMVECTDEDLMAEVTDNICNEIRALDGQADKKSLAANT